MKDIVTMARENDQSLPYMYHASLDDAVAVMEKVEFTDQFAKPQEIRFERDEIFIGKDKLKITTSFLEQIMHNTGLKKNALKALGDEKFIENLNFVFKERSQGDMIIRSVDGAAYAMYNQKGHRFNPANHKRFILGVREAIGDNFEGGNFDVTWTGGMMRLLATHPNKYFDVGAGDIQREGVEFTNNDLIHKYSFQYHLLRTACTNSTIFRNGYFSAERDSFEGEAGFHRFMRDAMRMFDQGKDMLPAYSHMKNTPLTVDKFEDVYNKVQRVNKRDVNKILHPYLTPNLVTGEVQFNDKRIHESVEYDLFNDLTHYSKSSDLGTQRECQAIAGDMIVSVLRPTDRRLRVG